MAVNLLDVPIRWVFTFYLKYQWSQAKCLSLGNRPNGLSEVGEKVKLQELQYETKWSVVGERGWGVNTPKACYIAKCK